MEVYVPAASPDAFIPNDNDPVAEAGKTSQLLLADLASITIGVPVLDERVEVLFSVVPFFATENESDDAENDNFLGITVRVTCKVALS